MKKNYIWIGSVFVLAALIFLLLYLLAGNKQSSPGLMRSDSLGDLRIDMPERKVIELLGEPGEKGEQLLSEADALYHQEWRYPRQGIFLDLASPSTEGKQRVASIRVGLHSILETSKGIKVGDSFTAVNKAYADQLDADNSDPPFTLLAGSLYGGVLFSFEEGKVIQIFLGAAAE